MKRFLICLVPALFSAQAGLSAASPLPDSARSGFRQNTPCKVAGRTLGIDGLPAPAVTVILEPEGQAVDTDGQGRYCFTTARPGQLWVRADGEKTHGKSSLALLAAGSSVTLDVVLMPVYEEQVVVTATRTPRRLVDTPVRVEVVGKEKIEQAAARTLADAVETTPGLLVENMCQNCNFQQVRMLGLEGAYSQILIDGQPLVSALAAVYGLEHIPARFIDRIEIVKGGGSSLYGPGSVAGVINVIPREPKGSGGTVALSGTSLDGDLSTSFGGGYDWVSGNRRTLVSAFGQRDRVEPYDRDGDGFTDGGYRDLDALGIRFLHYTPTRDGRLAIDLGRIEEERRGGDRLDLPPQKAEIAEWVQSDRKSASIAYDQRFGNAFDFHLVGAAALTRRDTYYGSGRDPNAFGKSDNPLFVFDAQFNHRTRNHVFSWGAQHSRDGLEDEQPAYGRRLETTYTNTGLFAQSDWNINPRLTLVSGFRADQFSALDKVVISPRVAVRCTLGPELRLRASIATGFRGPQVFDEDLHITQVGGEGAVIRNADDLDQESSVSTMVGLEWLPRNGHSQDRFEVNLFRTTIRDIFATEQTDDPATPSQLEFTRSNAGRAEVYGIEANAIVELAHSLDLDLGVVAQRARYANPEPDFGSRDFFRTPELYGLAGLVWRTPILDFRVSSHYIGSIKVPHYAGYIAEDRLETTPSFFTIDVGLSRRLALKGGTWLELALVLHNLTDEYQDDLDQGPHRDSGYVYGPREARQIRASLRWDF